MPRPRAHAPPWPRAHALLRPGLRAAGALGLRGALLCHGRPLAGCVGEAQVLSRELQPQCVPWRCMGQGRHMVSPGGARGRAVSWCPLEVHGAGQSHGVPWRCMGQGSLMGQGGCPGGTRGISRCPWAGRLLHACATGRGWALEPPTLGHNLMADHMENGSSQGCMPVPGRGAMQGRACGRACGAMS